MEKSKIKKVKKDCGKPPVKRSGAGFVKGNNKEIAYSLKKENSLFSKIIIRVITIILITAIFFILGFFAIRKISKVETESDFTIVDRQLSFCQELVSLKYGFSDVIALKKKAGLAKSYSIVKYSGIVKAGIKDIANVTYDVSDDGKKIVLIVPPAIILGHEIKEQDVFDEKQSIFVKISTQEIFDEIEEAKNAAIDDLLSQGFLEEAWSYAANVIKQFMYGCGFEDVIIKKSSILV